MIELAKDIEFNKCVQKEIKQSIWTDAKNALKATWNSFVVCVKWGILLLVICVIAGVLCVLFGNIVIAAGESTSNYIQDICTWVGEHYIIAGISIVTIGVLMLILAGGLLYFSSKLDTAIAECNKRWKEHCLRVDQQEIEKFKKHKDTLDAAGLIIIAIALVTIIIGIGVACIELLIGLFAIAFVICVLGCAPTFNDF